MELDVPVNGFLNWLQIPLAVSYSFEIAEDSTFEKVVLSDTSITDNYYYYHELDYSTEYYWRVRAVFVDDTSNWSSYWIFTTTKEFSIPAPMLVSPVNDSQDNQKDGLFTWKSIEEASYYELNVSKTKNFDSLIFEEFYLTDTSFAYTEFEPDTTYYWRVKAFSSIDSSNWSSIWSFTIEKKQELGFIFLIHPFFNSMQIPLETEFRWTSEEHALQYQLQITDFYFHEDSLLVNAITSDTVYYYSCFEKNERYFWRVRYITETDTSMWSFPWIFTTEPVVLLDKPELLYPINNIKKIPVDIEFRWNNVERKDIYMLECSRYPYFFPWKYFFYDIEEDILEYSKLQYNTKYYWRLMAYNDSSYSQWSDVGFFYTELQPPIVIYPDSSQFEVKVNGSIVWDTVRGAENYVIEFSKDKLFEVIQIEEQIFDKLSYSYSLEEDTEYFYRLKAINDSNESRWTYKSLRTEKITDVIEKTSLSKNVIIYPNPAKNEVIAEISNNESNKVEVEIMNIIGETVFQGYYDNSGSDQILLRMDVSDLCSGVYFLICEFNSEIIVKKLIVNP
jgi:hypothetical protein